MYALFQSENLKGRDHFGSLDGIYTLKLIYIEKPAYADIDLIQLLRISQRASSSSESIYQLLKRDHVSFI
jgi:hypothetical protein